MENANEMMICILTLGLLNICPYFIRIPIETFTNLKQILEKKP